MCAQRRTLCEAVELAEKCAEHPALGETVDEVYPGTRRRHHDVGDGKVDDEVVSRRVHALVACDDEKHGHVTNQRRQNDVFVQRRQNDNTVHRRLQRPQNDS